jgi:hypothetical protein
MTYAIVNMRAYGDIRDQEERHDALEAVSEASTGMQLPPVTVYWARVHQRPQTLAFRMAAYVSIRHRMSSAYVRIRQQTSVCKVYWAREHQRAQTLDIYMYINIYIHT